MFLSYLYVLSRIDFASFYDFSIEFRKCSDNVVFVVFVLTEWYLLFLFRQCGICCFCSLSEQKQQIPHCRNKNNKYHIVRTKTTNTTLSEQKQQIPLCQNKNNKYHIVWTKTTNTTLSEKKTTLHQEWSTILVPYIS
jgi:hypothetical protein